MISRGNLRRLARVAAVSGAAIAALLIADVSAASAAGVTGYNVVQGALTNITPGQTVSASVSCSAGQDVLSGGVSAHSPQTFIQSSYPTSADSWSVTMTDTGTETYTEHFTPYAVCVDASSVSGIHLAEVSSLIVGPDTYYGTDNAAGDAYCNTGEVVVGGGVQATDPDTLLTISQPTSDERAWDVFVHLINGSDAPSTYNVYSVCIPSTDVSSYSIQTASYGAYGTFLATDQPGGAATGVGDAITNTAGSPYCPSGTVAVAGGSTSHDWQNEFVSSVYPAPGDSHYWLATETDTFPPSGYDEYFLPSDICVTQQVAVATTLTAYPQLWLLRPLESAGYGWVEASLTSGGSPVVGREVTFNLGPLALCNALTNYNGIARCAVPIRDELLVLFTNHYSAAFAGDSSYLPSSSTTPTLRFF
jgi:hypothetical protein